MEQMRRYGIPASITLAQGIIESADGKSNLANTANNHFGVKGAFNGNYVLANDDRPNEKFKKYDNVGQSYEDHSKVLMANRYQQYTKNLSPDDYKGWAEGIKKGGYATAGNYVSTIVNVIENCNLQRFDQLVIEQMKREGKKVGAESNPLAAQNTNSNLKSTGMNLPQGQYSMPVERKEFMLVTSNYGMRMHPIDKEMKMHNGIDINTRHEALLATENGGKVVGTGYDSKGGGGNFVKLEYQREDGTKNIVTYCHLSEIRVKTGDTVNAGQKIGVSGSTGKSTGDHLHLSVVKVMEDGKKQWVNPSAYLAEIAQKGNLNIQAQYNGKNLLAEYKSEGATLQQSQQTLAQQQTDSTPVNWLQKLMFSDDAAMGFDGSENGILGSIVQMFMTLLMLTMQMEEKTKEEKMQAITDAVANRKVDLSSFTPSLKSSSVSVTESGKAILTIDDGKNVQNHELTDKERNSISQILSADTDDATKRQRIGTLVTTITYNMQAAQNYEQIDALRQSQEQTIQRR